MASSKVSTWLLGARSETGYVRSANEDRMAGVRTAYGNVYIVSDGMGGYKGGALAAELVVSTLRERLSMLSPSASTVAEQVRQAFLAANQEVYQRRRGSDPDTHNMGATGVALITWGAQILVGHVGDSRAYLWRKRSGLKRLTRDHTRVQKMVDAGLVSEAQAAVHPEASVLDRAIGHQPTVDVDVSPWMTLKSGEMVLLCSDGLCGYVEDEEIAKVLGARGDPQTLAHRLVDCALMKGGEDNVTVQLVRFGGASGASLSEWLAKPGALLPVSAIMSAAVAWGVSTTGLSPAADKTTDARASKPETTQAELIALKASSAEMARTLALVQTQVNQLAAAANASAPAPSASPAPSLRPEVKPAPKKATAEKKSARSPATPLTASKGRATGASSAAGAAAANTALPAASAAAASPAPASNAPVSASTAAGSASSVPATPSPKVPGDAPSLAPADAPNVGG